MFLLLFFFYREYQVHTVNVTTSHVTGTMAFCVQDLTMAHVCVENVCVILVGQAVHVIAEPAMIPAFLLEVARYVLAMETVSVVSVNVMKKRKADIQGATVTNAQ